jgi:hypothetical protein
VKRFCNTLSFERLESRLVLAGNITASQVGEDLVIVGDDLANSLTLGQSGAGSFTLSGMNRDFVHDTTVNGQNTGTSAVVFNGVTGNVVIRLGNGDDQIQTDRNSLQIEIGKALVIDAGAGNDQLAYLHTRSVRIGTQLVVNLGDGHDHFNGLFITAGTDQIVYGESGNDTIIVQGGTARNVAIHSGDGFDAAHVVAFQVLNSLLLDGGNEGDHLVLIYSSLANDSAVVGGSGGDAIYVSFTASTRTFLINGGADFAYIEIKQSSLAGNCYVVNEGPTQINFDLARFKRLEIFVGPQGDSILLTRCAVEELFASLGEASDLFTILATQVTQRARIDGQGGFDVFGQGDNVVTGFEVLGFEYFLPPRSL